MKLLIVGTLLALAASLRIEKTHDYVWEVCLSNENCPSGKHCGGISFTPYVHSGWCVEN